MKHTYVWTSLIILLQQKGKKILLLKHMEKEKVGLSLALSIVEMEQN